MTTKSLRGSASIMRWSEFAGPPDVLRSLCLGTAERAQSLSGVRSAAAYEALRGGPRHLVLAELSSLDVAGTPGHIDGMERLEEDERRRVQQADAVCARRLRNLYRRIFPVWDDSSSDAGPAAYIMMGRMDIPAAVEEEFNDWYDTVYIPGFLGVDGCLRARRFVAVEGRPKYLTLYEFGRDGVAGSEAWHAARTSNPWSGRMAPRMKHDELSPAYYRRISP